jgi:hypothetical protein
MKKNNMEENYVPNDRITDEAPVASHSSTPCNSIEQELIQLLKEQVSAWESLPGGRNYNAKEIERWLRNNMSPSIDKLRTTLNRIKYKKPIVLHTECLDKNRGNNDECKHPIGSCELCKNRF